MIDDGDVIEEESLGDGVANGELEEDFCVAGELCLWNILVK